MGASSSGLLDEAKISNIKDESQATVDQCGIGATRCEHIHHEERLVDSTFQSFSVFYHQQYSAAYFRHLHQEVEPKREGRSLLLTHRPPYAPEEVVYQGSVKFSCWDEQGKKCRERYTVLRRDYSVEIHENMETFSRGCAAKLIFQPAGGNVFTTEQESRAHLEKTCATILNGVKEDSSLVVLHPDVFSVYLHLPYVGHTCFLFQQEEERDHFRSALKTCIRHCNLDPWCDSSYESQAYIQALRLYRQDKGRYECWELLLGTEEQVLASQVMEELLPWLQSQLQSRVKGKKTERTRQWLATVQATYTLVLEQLTGSLEALREECRQTASANQALIRSNLDQIMSSHNFLEEKVRACICEGAEKGCSESVAPYMSSILEALTENISAGIQGMQQTLHTQMDSAFTHTHGGPQETKKALSTLRSISLDQCYWQVENLAEKLEGLKQRFGLSSTQRLVHSAHLEMEKLLDNAVYTLELFLQSSARLQPSHIPVKMERAKERVLKQLDYDSRLVQRRLYQEALLEITLPALTRRMDSRWNAELQQFEQYIFSDYSSFILVHNVYDDVLRSILSEEIQTVVQDAASKKSNNLLLDPSDLGISQYSLLGQTPPLSAPDSPALHVRASSASASEEPAPVVEGGGEDATCDLSTTQSSEHSTALLSPVIVVTQQFNESSTTETSCFEETREGQLRIDTPSTTAESSTSATSAFDAAVTREVGTPDNPESIDPIPDCPDHSLSTLSSLQSTDVPAECAQSGQSATQHSATADLSTSDQVTDDATSLQHPCPSASHPPCKDKPMEISLESLSNAIGVDSATPSVMQPMAHQTTDRAIYLTGGNKDNWEVKRVKEQKQLEAAEEKEEEMEEERGVLHTGGESVNKDRQYSECSAERAATLTTEQRRSEESRDDEDKGSEERKDEEEGEEKGDHAEKEEKKGREEEVLQSPQPTESQPEGAAELPLDSVATIRDLVTEITEVETVISPRPSSGTP